MKSSTILATLFGAVCTVGPILGVVSVQSAQRRCATFPKEWCPDFTRMGVRIGLLTVLILAGRYFFALALGRRAPATRPTPSSPTVANSIYEPYPSSYSAEEKASAVSRNRRFSHNVFKFLYFLLVSSYYYILLHEEKMLPTELGGTHNFSSSREGILKLSLAQKSIFPAIESYFFLNTAFHVASLLMLGVETTTFGADPWETFLQVALAVQLMVYGYLGEHWGAGAVLMVLHDLCDVLTSFAKCLVNLRYRFVAAFTCLVLIVVWAYLRLYTFWTILLFPLLRQLDENPGGLRRFFTEAKRYGSDDVQPLLFAVLFLVLLFLNIYWFSLMVKSILIFVFSGKITDAHVPETAPPPPSEPAGGDAGAAADGTRQTTLPVRKRR